MKFFEEFFGNDWFGQVLGRDVPLDTAGKGIGGRVKMVVVDLN